MTATIRSEIQKPDPDARVELFAIDATMLGGSILRFCASTKADGSAIVFNGHTYAPCDIEAVGFDYNGDGPLPTPKLRVSNAQQLFRANLIAYNNLGGAKLTRISTHYRFTDGQPDADPTMKLEDNIYVIDRKVHDNPMLLEFELAAEADQAGKKLPGRLILQNICTRSYRVWNGSAFDYSDADCPYDGTAYFTHDGASTMDPAQDSCSRRLVGGCKARYGTQPLPFWGFPGAAKARP